jgi:hypothetical protein
VALRVNTVARATAISSLFALTTGAIAAIALPPQIAVPKERSVERRLEVPARRPRRAPAASVSAIPTTV